MTSLRGPDSSGANVVHPKCTATDNGTLRIFASECGDQVVSKRGQVFGHAEDRAFPSGCAQCHQAERRSIRHARAVAHPTAPHATHADHAGVSFGKCLAIEVHLAMILYPQGLLVMGDETLAV